MVITFIIQQLEGSFTNLIDRVGSPQSIQIVSCRRIHTLPEFFQSVFHVGGQSLEVVGIGGLYFQHPEFREMSFRSLRRLGTKYRAKVVHIRQATDTKNFMLFTQESIFAVQVAKNSYNEAPIFTSRTSLEQDHCDAKSLGCLNQQTFFRQSMFILIRSGAYQVKASRCSCPETERKTLLSKNDSSPLTFESFAVLG